MQRTKSNPIYAIGFLLLLGLTACDPGHHGTASIDNQSSESLTLHYQTRYQDTTIIIPSKTKKAVLSFGGIGEGRIYPGALFEFKEIELYPADTSKSVVKNITDMENWEMVNRNKHRFSIKPIDCWFKLTDDDIE